jgi:D-alanyl-lipoteichoic acid acyltransferase DltB (MBOAT superfamily)
VIVGYLRLCGFNVFRNTYKPLLAETIVEFWNRYYYYFKELLVNFFFFPTFVRYFKRNPRLRLLAAVFAAAFLGNLYFHVIGDKALARGDWQEVAENVIPRANYCFLLAFGIYISMQREQHRPRPLTTRPWPRRALAILGVWTFFAFIRVFLHGDYTIQNRLEFVLGLFGTA